MNIFIVPIFDQNVQYAHDIQAFKYFFLISETDLDN